MIFLHANDHNFGGLDEGCGSLSFFKLHFAYGAGRNQRSDQLPSHRESDLSNQAAHTDVDDTADQLIAAADALVGHAALAFIVAARAVKQSVNFGLRDPVVASGRLHGSELAVIDPLLDGWVADLKLNGGVPRTK